MSVEELEAQLITQLRAELETVGEKAETKRAELQVFIDEERRLRAKIAMLTGERMPTQRASSARSGPSVATLIQDILTRTGPMGYKDLYEEVNAVSQMTDDSFNGTLQRMYREGRVVKPERGIYTLP